MSKAVVLAAATAVMFGTLSLGPTPGAEAGGYRHWDGGVVVFYGRPYEGYSGYRPYYGRYYYGGPYYGRPAGIFRPAGIVYRPFYAEPSPRYCGGWGWVRSRCGKYTKWRCLAW
jgi:hypothetical protein